MPAKFELIAPCFFGCESTAKFELTRIGAENIRVEDGRLSFAGGADMIAAANLNLRTVERVMLLLARYVGGAAARRRSLSGHWLFAEQPAVQCACLPEHHQKSCGQAPDGKAPHLCAAGDRRGVQDPLHAAQGSV